MAIVYGYATLAELKTYLNITGTADDARLESAIESASRAIDMETSRRFYALTDTVYFQTDDPMRCDIDDDLLSVTSISIDTTGNRDYVALGATDYELDPENAPYRTIWIAPGSSKAFPINQRRGVKVVASWGYNATNSYPQAVNKACLMLAARYFKRKDSVFGVMGTPELGYVRVTSKDTDIRALLQPYRRYEMSGV